MANVLTDDTNYKNIANAIRAKNGKSDLYKPSDMAEAISELDSGISLDPLDNPASSYEILNGYQAYDENGNMITGIYDTGTPSIVYEYVIGQCVTFTLSDWDPDVQGTTYTLSCPGYTIGENGVQLGFPPDSSTVNTQAIIAAALTIVNTGETTGGYASITINAVNSPERELTIGIFGLEEIANE